MKEHIEEIKSLLAKEEFLDLQIWKFDGKFHYKAQIVYNSWGELNTVIHHLESGNVYFEYISSISLEDAIANLILIIREYY